LCANEQKANQTGAAAASGSAAHAKEDNADMLK